MRKNYVLGIDAGGTHTDAVLLAAVAADAAAPGAEGVLSMRLAASAKVKTLHHDLAASVREALRQLAQAVEACEPEGHTAFQRVSRVTLGATLAVNALVQNRVDRVGLALSAGPGLDPRRFALGRDVCLVAGGLDHRGAEVSPLRPDALAGAIAAWRAAGVTAVACVGKFSPRNAAHELAMAEALRAAEPGLPVTLGHRLSGRLNFPRRIATAWFNAAVQRLHNEFLDAVEGALARVGIQAAVRLLKADGGAVPLSLSRSEAVQSILSGPAASVMGVLALCRNASGMDKGCSLLLDMGGTTTDMALFLNGSPVVDRDGMLLMGRRTLVRALASVSIGVGGDSLVTVQGAGEAALVRVGPVRQGPALAFGGLRPTLLDALNVCNEEDATYGDATAGHTAASVSGMAALAAEHGLATTMLARKAVDDALAQVARAARALVDQVNARPIYTLAALRAAREARPHRAWLVGGPAACVANRLAGDLGLPVARPPHADVANAVGAALAVPTDALELYADTGRGLLNVPTLALKESIGRGYTLAAARERACALLGQKLAAAGAPDARVEVTEAEVFAVLDQGGLSSKDMRVTCQVVPGIAGTVLSP